MKIGCHVSNNGEKMLLGAVEEALSYQANCLMIYLGAPQNTFRKPFSEFKTKEAWTLLQEHGMSPKDIIVHAPYIVNLAQSDSEKRAYAVRFITDEVLLADKVGSQYIVIHPGATLESGLEIGLDLIITSFREILVQTKDTSVNLVIETMAGKGTECCFAFAQIDQIIKALASPRIKVCLDTCHISDAGYDLKNNYEAVLGEFKRIIGFDRLAVIHVNDSKNVTGARKDRHENIGFGMIGFETLARICHDSRFASIPKILETPYVKQQDQEYPPYKYEIEMIRQNKFNPNIKDLIINQ